MCAATRPSPTRSQASAPARTAAFTAPVSPRTRAAKWRRRAPRRCARDSRARSHSRHLDARPRRSRRRARQGRRGAGTASPYALPALLAAGLPAVYPPADAAHSRRAVGVSLRVIHHPSAAFKTYDINPRLTPGARQRTPGACQAPWRTAGVNPRRLIPNHETRNIPGITPRMNPVSSPHGQHAHPTDAAPSRSHHRSRRLRGRALR